MTQVSLSLSLSPLPTTHAILTLSRFFPFLSLTHNTHCLTLSQISLSFTLSLPQVSLSLSFLSHKFIFLCLSVTHNKTKSNPLSLSLSISSLSSSFSLGFSSPCFYLFFSLVSLSRTRVKIFFTESLAITNSCTSQYWKLLSFSLVLCSPPLRLCDFFILSFPPSHPHTSFFPLLWTVEPPGVAPRCRLAHAMAGKKARQKVWALSLQAKQLLLPHTKPWIFYITLPLTAFTAKTGRCSEKKKNPSFRDCLIQRL